MMLRAERRSGLVQVLGQTGPSSERRERWLVAGICGVAALHVLLMGAAFPFFNNVDEQAHVDVVLKYARGDFPSERNVPYDASSGRLFILYRSLEYRHGPESFPRGVIPRPLSTLPPERSEERVARASDTAVRTPNHEIHSPPAYYILASAWYRVGSALGLTDISALYWVRFLNAPLVALACWLAWAFCREAFPGRPDLRLGVPMLLACLPQDAFYSINSDALSVPLLVLSLWLLLRWRSAEAPAAWLSVALGASVAATFLVKLTNVVLPVLVAAVVLVRLRADLLAGRSRRTLLAATLLALVAAVPVGFFAAHNRATVGDWTGTAAKVAELGWSSPEAGSLWMHPVMTPSGLWTLWDGVLRTFWRGEFVWHGERLAHTGVDLFFSISSALLLATLALGLLLRRRPEDRGPPRLLGWLGFVFGASLLTLAALSVSFDFGDAKYPSRDHPFFTSGRLILGALVPFLVLYVDGIATVLGGGRPGRPGRTLIGVGIVCAIAAGSGLWLAAPVWSSPYNWFHLP